MAKPSDYSTFGQKLDIWGKVVPEFPPGWGLFGTDSPIDYDPGDLDIPIDEREEYQKQKRRPHPGIHPMDPAHPKPEWFRPGESKPRGPRPGFVPMAGGFGGGQGGANTWQNIWKDFRFKGV